MDDYELDFSHGAIEWAVAPLADGKVWTLVHRYYAPPVTPRFNALLRSIQRGRPDYDDLAPELAASLRSEWPALQQKFKEWGKLRWEWGRLESTFFVREEDDGSYTYAVSFGRHRVGWNVLVSPDTGKIAAMTYADPDD
jgi:hypothetical protein